MRSGSIASASASPRLGLTRLGLLVLILIHIHRLWPWGIVGGQRRRRSQIINKLDFSSKFQVVEDEAGGEGEVEGGREREREQELKMQLETELIIFISFVCMSRCHFADFGGVSFGLSFLSFASSSPYSPSTSLSFSLTRFMAADADAAGKVISSTLC